MSETDQKLRELIDARHEMVKAQDYFGVLGLDRSADQAAIQKAYFALAKQVHPDKMANAALDADLKARAGEVFKFVSDAYNTLNDPAKRQAIVRSLEEGKPNPFADGRGKPGSSHVEESKIFQHKGQRLIQMRGYAEAERFLRQAMRLAPNDAGIMIDLGWAIFSNEAHPEKERLDEAFQLWSRARTKDKDDPRAHYYTALYFKATGDIPKARGSLEVAVALKPNYIEAQRELRLIGMREQKGGGGRGGSGATPAKGKGFLEQHLPSLAKLFKGGKKR